MNRTTLNKNPNKIVVVVCGPAHSGKSVFLNQLYKVLPSNRTHLVRGCPDGEGFWSYGKNQRNIKLARKKGKFSKEFVDSVINEIENSESDIVLVDVGGIPSEENVRIMSHSDYYVIVSSDREKTWQWQKYVDSFEPGLEVPVQERFINEDGKELIIHKKALYKSIMNSDYTRYRINKRRIKELDEERIKRIRKPRLLAKLESVLGKDEDEYVGSVGLELVGRVKNLTRKSEEQSLAAVYVANRLIDEVRSSIIDDMNQKSVSLNYDEEFLSEDIKKNIVDMDVLRKEIETYTRMFIREDKRFIHILTNKDGKKLVDVRRLIMEKHKEIIANRIHNARQNFLLEVKGKDAVKRDVIDINKVADFFGMSDENGYIIWNIQKLPEMAILLDFLMENMEKVKVYGYVPNWLSGTIGDLRKGKHLEMYCKSGESFESMEVTPKIYAPYQKSFTVLESEDSVLLHWDRMDREGDVYLPEIPENKKLYIAGRMSDRMVAAIMQNYNNYEKSINVPGVGFIKCASVDKKKMGTVEKQPRGIDYIAFLAGQQER